MHNIVIETERLLLRPLTVADAKEVFEWVSDERVSKYMVYNTYRSEEQVVDWLKFIETVTDEYHFGFVRKSDGKLIGSGSIGPDAKRNGFWGFGYNFRYDCWGNGFATEATKAMIKYVSDNLGAGKFASSHVEQNKASGRVMENVDFILLAMVNFRNWMEVAKRVRWNMRVNYKILLGIDAYSKKVV